MDHSRRKWKPLEESFGKVIKWHVLRPWLKGRPAVGVSSILVHWFKINIVGVAVLWMEKRRLLWAVSRISDLGYNVLHKFIYGQLGHWWSVGRMQILRQWWGEILINNPTTSVYTNGFFLTRDVDFIASKEKAARGGQQQATRKEYFFNCMPLWTTSCSF